MRGFAVIALCAATAAFAGCAHEASKLPPAPAQTAVTPQPGGLPAATGARSGKPDAEPDIGRALLLSAGDTITVKVYREPELTSDYTIDADGAIQMPLVGRVIVAGKTAEQVTGEITASLRNGYLVNPQVAVIIKQINSGKIYVMGEVKNPGVFPYSDRMTVIEAVSLAGGATDQAAVNDTSITRFSAGDKKRYRAPVEDIGKGQAPNIELVAGDIIYVPRSIF